MPGGFAWKYVRRFGFDSVLDASIHALSTYGLPLVIGAIILIAPFAWEPRFEADVSRTLELAVIEDRAADLGPVQAAARLQSVAPVSHFDTRLSEAPFWFAFTADASGGVVELPSRHALGVKCWDVDTLQPIGQADRTRISGGITTAKAGFAISLVERAAPTRLLCSASFSGPARISARQWPSGPFAASSIEFHRNAALLEGGLLVLAAFALITAIVNRTWLYVLFAAWLVASLRLGAISAGWDTTWLGYSIPVEWIFAARKFTIAAYFVLTYALFMELFRDDLKRIGTGWPLALARWCCVAVLAATVLPFARFLPVLWVTVGVGASAIAFYLLRILLLTRTLVAMWYAAALGIAVFAGFYEVVAAALGIKALIGAVNNVTSALLSSLLVALAIAEHMRLERVERLQAQAALKSAYDTIPIGLFTLARDGAFERVNPALAEMLGIDPQLRVRQYWRNHFEAGSWDWLRDQLLLGKGDELDIRGRGRDGGKRWFHVKMAPAGEKIEGSLQDVTVGREATAKLEFLAENDPLTGVLNRRGIEKIIEEATRFAVEGRPLAVAYLDLDRFKLINELFGHVAGDDVLRQVCRRIESVLDEGGSLGRIGGDEFIVVFRDVRIDAAGANCRAIVEAIAATPFLTADKAFQVKVSIGLVEVADRLVVSEAIAVADRACRAAKTGAQDGLVVYERGSNVFRKWADERRLVERLGSGTAPEGLFLMMQPIMSLRAPEDSLNFEVLVRMRDADGSITPGGVIVATAENNGRASVIDRWVLSSTLAWLDRHHASLAATHFVTMNLSGASLNDERFIKDAYAMLAGSPRAAVRLCIEITEGVALHDMDNTRRFIDGVRGYGAKVALDDFGAGYTSFSYLRELPADALKIDGSLIVNVNAHPANLAIVEAIVELARNLGMKSIAEWAEDCATVVSLAQAGVDYVQGFVIAHAQEPDALLAARSSAGFITDAALLRYVRDTLASEGGCSERRAAHRSGPAQLH